MEKILSQKRELVKQFNVALPPSLVARLDELAKQRLTSRSTLIRQLIAQMVRESLAVKEVRNEQ